MDRESNIKLVDENQTPNEKIDGKLIVDEYQAIERIHNRLDTIWSAYYNTVNDPSGLWCKILDDVGYSAIEDLREILDNMKQKSTVIEYIQASAIECSSKLQPV